MPSQAAAAREGEHDDVLPRRVRALWTQCTRLATAGRTGACYGGGTGVLTERESVVTTMADDRGEHSAFPAFRQRLDAILRQRDPAALRAFLVAEGQWQPEQQADDEAAMWMMIAGSPTLAEMHSEAERWLASHGHEAEAQAILGRRRPAGQRAGAPHTGGARRQHGHPLGARHGARDGHGRHGGHGQPPPPKRR